MSCAKPFSSASLRNREPILAVLREVLPASCSVLEIGSGTGQHAVFFAAAMPGWQWQCADLRDNLPGIRLWRDEAALPNLPPPIEFDVNQADWPAQRFDAVYTANTLHIMAWSEVERLFARLPDVLADAGRLVVYGPFNYGGRFTSDGNAAFDARLRGDDPRRGIRDFEAISGLATGAGLDLIEDRPMPANNRCLVWRRRAQSR